MRRLHVALALLLISSGAQAQEYHAVGSICSPTIESFKEPVCTIWYAPVGHWPRKSFHEDIVWANNLKTNRLVSTPHTIAQAAPK